MANQLDKLLGLWHSAKNAQQWVLATIINTAGSSYRKAGAMMMINDLGQYYGMLSGGCLESDIMRQARRCWDDGLNRIIKYDMREEEDLAWQLGIGCGGMVEILLQPVNSENNYLHLDSLHQCLLTNQTCAYIQAIDSPAPDNTLEREGSSFCDVQRGIVERDGRRYFGQLLRPAHCLAVFGGGLDARPVVTIAAELGWQVLLLDPRSGYARQGYFNGAQQIYRQAFCAYENADWLQNIDAALVMSHNIKLDAAALNLLQVSRAKYVGLLGPIHRTQRVMEQAELRATELNYPLANPVGLRLGGELPESIALSMIAEVHAFLEGSDGQSISQVLA